MLPTHPPKHYGRIYVTHSLYEVTFPMSYRNVGSSCPHYRERRRSPHRTDSDALYAVGGGNTGPASSVTTNFTPYYLDKKHRREDTPVFLLYLYYITNYYLHHKFQYSRSVSGVAVMLGGTVVNASSTTQYCVTLSTSEAEYVAMAQGAKTALFTKAVLDFLQAELANETIDLFEDNQGAIAIAENPISGGRTKHIDVRYHFIRELVERKVLNIQYTESSNQHADILTKPLGLEAFARHRSFLMNMPE